MQTKLSYTGYNCFETTNNETIECPIDIEYSLPDYCPDIRKILKCIPYVDISTYSFTQDRFMCEGKLTLYVQYTDEKSGGLRVCEIVKEYSQAKDISQNAERTIGRVKAETGHIVCRAVSARKLDVHVPIILNLSMCTHKQGKLTQDVEDLEKKHEEFMVSHAVDEINQRFEIEQELELSKSAMPIESILRKSLSINNVKVSALTDKVGIEALADICVIYRSLAENSTIEKMNYSIPINQFISIDGCDTDCTACADIQVCEFSVTAKEDSIGDNTVCQIYIKLEAFITVYKNKSLNLITDAYHTEDECDLSYENVSLVCLKECYKEKINHIKTVFLAEDEIEKLLDCYCEEEEVTAYCEKNRINYRGKYNISLMYLGKSKQVFCVIKTFDFTIPREFSESLQRKSEPKISMSIKDYKITDGNNVEFNCEGVLSADEYTTENKKILKDANVSTEEQEKGDEAYVKVYYSEKEECLWDIGKKFRVPVASIIESNGLIDEEMSPGGALVIF